MTTHWRVMLNSKKWNQLQYEENWKHLPETRRFAQSKGACPMRSCPKKGDFVSFVLKGKIRMKGRVESDGFENGTAHQHHSCNTGENRPHAVSSEFVWINITDIELSDYIRPTGQRTWVKIH